MEFAVATVLAVAGLAIAYWALRSQNRGKRVRLHYTSVSIPFVLPTGGTLDKLVRIWSGGQELVCPRLVLVRLTNTGQAPITPNDFDGPIRITFGKLALFMGGSIRWNRPYVLNVDNDPVALDQTGGLTLKPMLLNPRDQMTLVAVVDGITDDIKVTTRIAGVEEVHFIPPLHDGATSHMEVTSLLFERRDQWPTPRVINAAVVKGPVVVVPKSMVDVTVRVAGRQLAQPSHLALVLGNVAGREVNTLRTGDPLVLDLGDATIEHHYVEIDDRVVTSARGRWTEVREPSELVVKGVKLKSGGTMVVHVFASGDIAKVSVPAKPGWVDDITQFAHNLDSLIDESLVKTEPHSLLIDTRLHRSWHRGVAAVRWRSSQFRSWTLQARTRITHLVKHGEVRQKP